jgi:hypothetical protein
MQSNQVNSIFSGGIAAVNVGPNAVPFDCHLELLCDCSPYFSRIYKTRFTESPREPVILPDTDPDTFANFLAWAYRGTLTRAFDSFPTWIGLCRLWILADILEISTLQNRVIDQCLAMHDQSKINLGWTEVKYIYDNAAAASPLRRFAVNSWVSLPKPEAFGHLKGLLPRQFLEDICASLLEISSKGGEQQTHQLKGLMVSKAYHVDVPRSQYFKFTPDRPFETRFPHLGALDAQPGLLDKKPQLATQKPSQDFLLTVPSSKRGSQRSSSIPAKPTVSPKLSAAKSEAKTQDDIALQFGLLKV